MGQGSKGFRRSGSSDARWDHLCWSNDATSRKTQQSRCGSHCSTRDGAQLSPYGEQEQSPELPAKAHWLPWLKIRIGIKDRKAAGAKSQAWTEFCR
ncbi:hypothetical protein SynBOUM118_02126 [Synechococcus sp. BOUM118]|nr:hypothetical protein SynBOUM118_02126 [Synechococcus sp. BOUM118]